MSTPTMAANQMIDGSGMPSINPMLNNIANMTPACGSFDEPETVDPNLLALQQMRALEDIGWNGGENYYDGPHDDFCLLCGSGKELFNCQTCETCYHSKCMTPSLRPNEVPSFWFCPHCVDNELHIPPTTTEDNSFAPLQSSLPVYPPNPMSTSASSSSTPVANAPVTSDGLGTSASHPGPPFYREWPKERPIRQLPTPPGQLLVKPVKPLARPQAPSEPSRSTTQKKPGRQRNSSPPRKKSKYSSFSKEVDKALSVIYSELETAAGYGKSDGNLESKIQALEQQVKMHEGQMLLNTRELEHSRRELLREREEKVALKTENEMWKIAVDVKDSELREWRSKLRSMIGSELE